MTEFWYDSFAERLDDTYAGNDAGPDAALRARLEDWAENALDPQAAAAACLAVLNLHPPFSPTWKAIADALGIEMPEGGVVAAEPVLHDEYGILDDGGGLRQATTEPIPLRAWNAALSVELRAKGVFDPGGRRPARLMRRKATDWAEISLEVWPQDIFPGYVAREAGTQREVEV